MPIETVDLRHEEATRRLGSDLAMAIRAGDLVTLQGALGAGKSSLARAIIRTIGRDEAIEVPSPTFTLAQHYDLAPAILHVDLYRLENSRELEELGIESHLKDGAVLVEWPENGKGALPSADIHIDLTDLGVNGRRADILASPQAAARLKRSFDIRRFLVSSGHGHALRKVLKGDASTRTYETIMLDEKNLVLMNAPPPADEKIHPDGRTFSEVAKLATDVGPFVAISGLLESIGLSAPEIEAQDQERGLLLLEDLGDDSIARKDHTPIESRYRAAIETLLAIHRIAVPRNVSQTKERSYTIPDYNREVLLTEAELFFDWYVPRFSARAIQGEERQLFVDIWTAILDRLQLHEKGLVLRDYHSPNILWREDRQGIERVGLIDFQDAVIGPLSYDVASLVHDARLTIPLSLQEELLAHYEKGRGGDAGFDQARFRESFAIVAAQRATKILGLFVRLDERDGKPDYLAHLPRIRAYFRAAIAHETLLPLRQWLDRNGLWESLQ